MKRLIVNADDLGLTRSINEGISKAYRDGIVTSLNLIPTGEAFEEASDLIRDLKLEEIGAHLALTETAPLTDSGKISSLVTKDGRFCKNHSEFFIKFFLRIIDRGQVYFELKNQLDSVKRLGIKIANLSSHEYIHMAPEILKIFVSLAKEYGIPSIRYPHGDRAVRRFDINDIYRSLIPSCLDRGMKGILDGASIIYPDHFLGFLDSGRLKEEMLIDMLESLNEGTTELISHPGFLGPQVLDRYRWHINCEEELFALTSPRIKKVINDNGIKLITYHEFLLQRKGED